ncbi:MAG: NAD-dependent DNA ligase LigA [Candidatus Aminicenantes bacterium]|nr:NAD-dependent DNA ligase LigA [Candidatus Aminicenantes bacterium]
MDIKKRIDELSRELLRHQYLYYIKTEPEISDLEYDRLFDELLGLEKKYPQFALENSPTKRVGSDLDNTFPEKEHSIPVLSLDKEYNLAGLEKWLDKTIANAKKNISFVVEEKIDGASIVLYYKNGKLDCALTRGNGIIGNDVTENIRTIKQVPLITGETSDFAVRGEIFINKSDFENYNLKFENRYSNPRNLAAGSLRNLKSSFVAHVPLNILVYEGYFQENCGGAHILILGRLKELNFRINPHTAFFSDRQEILSRAGEKFPGITLGACSDLPEYVNKKMKTRNDLDYEIDGLVIKVDEIDVREALGFTAHHPRWATAFKFDAPTAQTTVLDIHIQVGKNGRVTPVAILEPVKIAGSTVSRATLHNLEYIEMLELGIGDLVSISKRGDIIPAVEEVVEKNPEHPTVFKFPAACPFCAAPLIKDGAHHFCKNRECPGKNKRAIIFFAAKDQMDIETLGDKTVDFLYEKGFVKSIPDIYKFDYDLLLQEEGFKEKKIENIKNSIEKSKSQPFSRVLAGLGFDGLGKAAISDLLKNGFDAIDKIIAAAAANDLEVFSSIAGFGEITARLLIRHFTDKQNLQLIEELKRIGLNFKEEARREQDKNIPAIFKGQVWVITGSFEHFNPRAKAAVEIEKRGGNVSGAVSSKTTHLLVGTAAGSKLDKARQVNAAIINEAQFLELLK